MIYLRIAWAAISIAAFWLLVCLPLTIIGFFVTPIGIALRRVIPSPITGLPIEVPPAFLFLWGNNQEGYSPVWYAEYRPKWPAWLRRYEWAAWRNSCNNLRFVKALHPPPDPARICFSYLRPNLLLIWQGAFHRIIWTRPNGTLLAGWKYDVSDAVGVRENDWRRYGVGFGIRWRRRGAPIGAWDD